jgi:hypothetical protein
MPQLDKFAFAPQVFWLVVIFFGLYLITLQNGLSTLYRIIVFRKKFISALNSDVSSIVVETLMVQQSTVRFIVSFVQNRGVVEIVFRHLEASLSRGRLSYEVLRAVRHSLVFSTVSPHFVGAKQSVIPTSKHYSSLKSV